MLYRKCSAIATEDCWYFREVKKHMSNHSSKGKVHSGMSDLFIDYNCGLTVRRAKTHSKAKGSSRTRDNE